MCAFTQRARAAGMAQSDFGRALAGAERRMERAAVELARTRRLLEREDMAGAFGSAFAFSAEVEKLACSHGCFRPIPGTRRQRN